MVCIRKYDLLGFHKKDLPEKVMAEIEEHLRTCAECRTELAWYNGLSSAINRTGEIEPSTEFGQNVLTGLNAALEDAARQEQELHPQTASEEEMSVFHWIIYQLQIYTRPLGSTRAWALSVSVHALLFIVIFLILMKPVKTQKPELPDFEIMPVEKTEDDIAWTLKPPPPVTGREGGFTPVYGLNDQSVWDYNTDFGKISGDQFYPITPEDYAPVPLKIDPYKNYTVRVRDKQKTQVLAYIAPFRNEELNSFLKTADGKIVYEAIRNGLKWLAKTQDKASGRWSPEIQNGQEEYTAGVSGLALLAFSGAGETHLSGNYMDTVRKGITYLLSLQINGGNLDGLLSPPDGNYMYNHGIATLALLDIYSMTNDKTLLPALEKAVELIVSAQSESGGWGYTVNSNITDSSVTGWQVMALVYAKNTGIGQNLNASMLKAKKWYTSITDAEGKVGYREKNSFPNGHIALTSVGMFCRQLLATGVEDQAILDEQEQLLMKQLPAKFIRGNERNTDYYYYYYGSLAMYQQGNETWEQWEHALYDALLTVQNKTGANAGSWEALDRWSKYGGRFYTTSTAILALESNFRFPRFNK